MRKPKNTETATPAKKSARASTKASGAVAEPAKPVPLPASGDGVLSSAGPTMPAAAVVFTPEVEQLLGNVVEAYRAIAAARFTHESAETPEDKAAAQPHLDAANAAIEAALTALHDHAKRTIETLFTDAVAAARPSPTVLAIDVHLDGKAFELTIDTGALSTREEKKRAVLGLLDRLNARIAELTDVELRDLQPRSTNAPPERGPDDGGSGNAAAPADTEGELVTLTVIGPKKGRRRAGFVFNATPQTITVPVGIRDALIADPELAVSAGATAPLAAGSRQLDVDAFLNPDGTVKTIKVLGPRKGRRRAGFQFGAEAAEVTPTVDQLKLILADADLAVMPAG